MHTMKTAISVEEKLLTKTDTAAHRLGISRSRLISMALERYLQDQEDEAITQQYNRLYADDPQTEELRIAAAMKTKLGKTIRDRW